MLAFLRLSATVAAIAGLNDALRCDPAAHGHVIFSPGVMALIDTATPRAIAPVAFAQQQLIQLAGLASDFTGSRRDRAERRCGRFSFRGHRLAFAIEYRDAADLRPARRPADPGTTRRILTISLDREGAHANPLPSAPRNRDNPPRSRGPLRPLAPEHASWPDARRPTIDQLLAALRRARRRRALRALAAPYPLRVAVLVLPMAAVTGFVAHAWIAAAGMILAGMIGILLWRRSLRIPRIIVPTQWLAGAVESNLTRDGRAALTRLLLDAPVTPDAAAAWAETERLRQHGRHPIAADPVPDRVH